MKRWTAIAHDNEDARWKLMSEHLNRVGVSNEFVPWTTPLEDWLQAEALQDFDHVRMSTRLGGEALKKLKVQSTWITLLGVVDGMFKREGSWWPLCALYESFNQLLVTLGPDMDHRSNVLLAGTGGSVRVALAAFFKAGFNHFLITALNQQEAEKIVNEVKRNFFGLKIDYVPKDAIVMLPGDTTVLVNCTPRLPENHLLSELAYLNFLRRPGFIFDLSLFGDRNDLREAADDAGVKYVSGVEIAARSDILWVNWAFNANLDLQEYMKGLLAVGTSAVGSPTVDEGKV